jgi:predicted secreted protein
MSAPVTNAPDGVSLAVIGKNTILSIQSGSSTLSGTVNTSGSNVTGETGSAFTAAMVGQPITINGVVYTVETFTSGTAITVSPAPGTQTAVNFTATLLTYTKVAELKTLDFSGSKNDTEDVTNFDSAGRAKEFVVTLLDMGEIKISGNYIVTDAGQTAFRAAFLSGLKLSFEIQLPINTNAGQTTSGDVWTFLGAVTELDNTFAYDKAITFSATVKVSGLIDVTPGS